MCLPSLLYSRLTGQGPSNTMGREGGRERGREGRGRERREKGMQIKEKHEHRNRN